MRRAPAPSARAVVAGRSARSTCPPRRAARRELRRRRGSSSDRAIAVAKRRTGPSLPTPRVFLHRETGTPNCARPFFLSGGKHRAGEGGLANTRGCRVVASSHRKPGDGCLRRRRRALFFALSRGVRIIDGRMRAVVGGHAVAPGKSETKYIC